MKRSNDVVYLVDDDADIREAIADLLDSIQLEVVTFESAEDFLRYKRSDAAGCLILDLQLPAMNGLELQERLASELSLPIIFLTGRGDIPSSVRAMKAGATEFLTKPVNRDALLAAIQAAFAGDRENRSRHAENAELKRRFSLLSPRERDVLPLIVAGMRNKQSAAILGITQVTLQIHRGHIMRKMAAGSFAELVRMCGAIGIPERTQRVLRPGARNLPAKPSSRR